MAKLIHASLLFATLCAATHDLAAQERGRFRRGGQQRPDAPTPEAPKPETDAPKKPKSYTAIVGGDVYLGTGQRLTGATVLVADDKIDSVGHNLMLPEGTKVIDAKGKVVSPGFTCVMGSGMGAGRNSPFVDSVNPFDPEIKQALAAGITSFLAGNAGSGNTPSGDNAVIKLAWGDVAGMVAVENTVCGLTVPMTLADKEKFADSVKKAKEHRTALDEFTKTKANDANAKPPQAPQGTEKILKVLAGEARLWIQLGGGGGDIFGMGRRGGGGRSQGNDVDGIRQALEVAQLLGVGVVLNKPVCAWLLPDEIAATGSLVILSPRDRAAADPTKPDRTGSNIASSAILAEAGVGVAVTCPGGMFGGAGVGTGGIMGQDLNTPHIDAAFAVRGGLDNRKALRTLTLDAARALGIDRRIGSLEAGKDADILILDGDPLHYRTFVEMALVNGKVVYEKDKEPFYRHIQR